MVLIYGQSSKELQGNIKIWLHCRQSTRPSIEHMYKQGKGQQQYQDQDQDRPSPSKRTLPAFLCPSISLNYLPFPPISSLVMPMYLRFRLL